MKKIAFAFLFVFSVLVSKAQSISDIYLNAEDFKSGKLSFQGSADSRHRIRLHEFLSSPRITIIEGKQHLTYAKDSVFGYRNRDGTSFRFFRRTTYEVLNADASPLLYKRAIVHGGKGAYTEVSYYFSKDAASPVLPLTRQDIRTAYAAHASFVERVYDSFASDNDLVQYDSFHKMYQLNRIYENLRTVNR